MGSSKIKIDIPYIIENKERLAELTMQTHYEKYPNLKVQYTPRIHRQCITDLLYTFSFLKLSIDTKDNNIFINYIKWLKVLLVSYNVPIEVTKINFEIMLEVLSNEGELEKNIYNILEEAIEVIKDTYGQENYKSEFGANEETCKAYLHSLLNVDRKKASKLILDAYYKQNLSMKEIYLQIIQPVMHEIGRLWQRNIITVAQEHYCSSATQWILAKLYHEIFNDSKKNNVYLGACVSNELHEMGGRMVADFYELGGWDSYYLGANTPASGLIDFIKMNHVDILGLSATMMMHVEELKKTIALIRKDEDCKHIKIIVGGYIFNQSPNLYKYVGADGFSDNAQGAYDLGCELISQNLRLREVQVC